MGDLAHVKAAGAIKRASDFHRARRALNHGPENYDASFAKATGRLEALFPRPSAARHKGMPAQVRRRRAAGHYFVARRDQASGMLRSISLQAQEIADDSQARRRRPVHAWPIHVVSELSCCSSAGILATRPVRLV